MITKYKDVKTRKRTCFYDVGDLSTWILTSQLCRDFEKRLRVNNGSYLLLALQYVQVLAGKTFSQLPCSVVMNCNISIQLFPQRWFEEARASPE